MLALFPPLKRWWRASAHGTGVPFEVECRCGERVRGRRGDSFQVVTCLRCRNSVFVLGYSPLPPVVDLPQEKATATRRRSNWQPWLLPVAAILLTVAVLVGVYFKGIKPLLWAPPKEVGPGMEAETTTPLSWTEQFKLAQEHLQQGHFRQATQVLQAAQAGLPTQTLTPVQRRLWKQLHLEAALLADLLTESLEDIVRHAAAVTEKEWQADFPHRYQGKAVLFDAEVHRQPDGRLEISYQVWFGAEKVQLALNDLLLLRQANLDQPRRVLIGGRLASVRLEPPGPVWVIRFQPDSGVWLTDPAAAAWCCPAWSDAPTRALLQEQGGQVK